MTDTGLIAAESVHTRTIKLGEFEVTTILDGFVQREKPETVFGTDQDPVAVADLLRANNLPTDRFVHCFVPTLVRTPGETVLFDTGFGPSGRAEGRGQLRNRLGEIGLSAEDISLVVMTHMHGDHVGGLMEEDGPAFPNARYFSAKEEFDFWLDDARMGTPAEGGAKTVRKTVGPLADQFSFFADGDAVLPGITAVSAPGHTPGHTAFMLESAGRRLMLTADTANHYLLSLGQPDWQVVFDIDKVKAAESRRRIFGMIADEGIPFIGHHMPFPSVGYVSRTEDGFRYMPATYQFDV